MRSDLKKKVLQTHTDESGSWKGFEFDPATIDGEASTLFKSLTHIINNVGIQLIKGHKIRYLFTDDRPRQIQTLGTHVYALSQDDPV